MNDPSGIVGNKYRKWSIEDAINIPIGKVRHYHMERN